jgi:hypothetical protein
MRLTTIFLVGTLISCKQETKPQPEEFLVFLNNYQTDSLQRILADNFQIKRTYTNYTTDRNSFFREYIQKSKAFNGKYNITKVIKTDEPRTYLAEDQSDYLKYLRVSFPTWKIIIARNSDNKIEAVTFDTTETFRKYTVDIQKQEASFKKWHEEKYPKEVFELLFENNKLLFERLEMYYNQN